MGSVIVKAYMPSQSNAKSMKYNVQSFTYFEKPNLCFDFDDDISNMIIV